MNILINAISARLGGGQTYITNLLSYIENQSIDNIYILGFNDIKITNNAIVKLIPVPDYVTNSPYIRYFWEKINFKKIISLYNINILFYPGGSISYRPTGADKDKVKTVVTFQNMLPFDDIQRKKYGFSTARLRLEVLKKVFIKSLCKADLVIFLSQYARDMALEKCNYRIKKNVLIPHGIDIPTKSPVSVNKGQLDNYFLYVSTIDRYKSQIEVVEAFSLLKKENYFGFKLVLAGSEYKPYKTELVFRIKKLGLENDVIFTGHVSKNELNQLYKNATLIIFASETENCPFILLESMSSGTPVVSSNYPPMPEFGGDAVLYFDPESPSQLCKVISSLLDSPELMDKYSKLSLERIKRYSLKKAVIDTWTSILNIRNSS